MTTELMLLGWAVVLGLVQILLAAGLGMLDHGMAWNAGNRDTAPKPLGVHAARADRASRNFLETFVFFAAVVLALAATGRFGTDTALAAELYLGARVLYWPCYVIGIPYLRSLIWGVSMVGLVWLLVILLA